MRDETKYFLEEYKEQKMWEERWKANHLDFHTYFKESGKTEPTKILISRYKYNHNNRCNDLHEKYIKKQDYEKIWKNKAHKDYPGRFTAEIEAHCWNETEDSVWSDKE